MKIKHISGKSSDENRRVSIPYMTGEVLRVPSNNVHLGLFRHVEHREFED